MAKKKHNKKYAFGGSTNDPLEALMELLQKEQDPSSIQSPESALTANQIMIANADQKSSNFLTGMMDMLGAAGLNYGLSSALGGVKGALGGSLLDTSTSAEVDEDGDVTAEMGGQIPDIEMLLQQLQGGGQQVEVEGEEAGELPGGQVVGFEGPSHEQGGMDVLLPPGTEMFSKRIKVDGVSLADRKKKRKKKTMSLEDLLEIDGTDVLAKNSLDRTREINDLEEEFDLGMQDFIRDLVSSKEGRDEDIAQVSDDSQEVPMAAFGLKNLFRRNKDEDKESGVDDTNFWGRLLEGGKDLAGDINLPDPTFGDALTMFSNYKIGQTSEDLALKHRAQSSPNINAFEDYGKNALKTLDESKDYVNQARDMTLKGIEESRRASASHNRGTSGSINTMRATDIASQLGADQAAVSAENNFVQQMASILQGQANLEASIDDRVMSGEQERDLNDRMDTGAFFTQLQQALQDKYRSTGQIGKDLNTIKQRQVTQEAINNLGDYWEVDGKTGKVKLKAGAKPTGKELSFIRNFDPSEIGISEKVWDSMNIDQKGLAIRSNGEIINTNNE